MKTTILTIALFSFGIAFSQQREDMNLRGERKRVAQGIKSGEINRNEARVIKNQTVQLQRTKARATSDGVVTPVERAKIARKDAKLDRTIHRTKHN